MSNITSQDIKKEFFRSKMGIAGIIILTILISTSVVTIVTIPGWQYWNKKDTIFQKRKAVNGVSLSIFKNVCFFQCFQQQKATRSMVVHYRYSKTYGFSMFPTAKTKTVNGFSLLIFKNLWFFNVFNSKKQNGQWFFTIDIQQRKVLFNVFNSK